MYCCAKEGNAAKKSGSNRNMCRLFLIPVVLRYYGQVLVPAAEINRLSSLAVNRPLHYRPSHFVLELLVSLELGI